MDYTNCEQYRIVSPTECVWCERKDVDTRGGVCSDCVEIEGRKSPWPFGRVEDIDTKKVYALRKKVKLGWHTACWDCVRDNPYVTKCLCAKK